MLKLVVANWLSTGEWILDGQSDLDFALDPKRHNSGLSMFAGDGLKN
jgi:hypothetical protein